MTYDVLQFNNDHEKEVWNKVSREMVNEIVEMLEFNEINSFEYQKEILHRAAIELKARSITKGIIANI